MLRAGKPLFLTCSMFPRSSLSSPSFQISLETSTRTSQEEGLAPALTGLLLRRGGEGAVRDQETALKSLIKCKLNGADGVQVYATKRSQRDPNRVQHDFRHWRNFTRWEV